MSTRSMRQGGGGMGDKDKVKIVWGGEEGGETIQRTYVGSLMASEAQLL